MLMEINLEVILTVAIVITGTFAILTLTRTAHDDARNTTHRRAERFSEMRRRFFENPNVRRLLKMIERDDVQLRDLSCVDGLEPLAVYQEIVMLVNSGIMPERWLMHSSGNMQPSALRVSTSGRNWTVMARAAPSSTTLSSAWNCLSHRRWTARFLNGRSSSDSGAR